MGGEYNLWKIGRALYVGLVFAWTEVNKEILGSEQCPFTVDRSHGRYLGLYGCGNQFCTLAKVVVCLGAPNGLL